jgi:preprotein translocase subunit SecG
MYIVLIIIHIVVCLILILTILLQAGRGGGLTESFGGDTTQSVLGTQAPVMLKRATEISAIVFLITSLLLAVVSSGRNRSLLNRMRMPDIPSGAYTTPLTGADMSTGVPVDTGTVDASGAEDLPVPRESVPAEK